MKDYCLFNSSKLREQCAQLAFIYMVRQLTDKNLSAVGILFLYTCVVAGVVLESTASHISIAHSKDMVEVMLCTM